MSIEKGGAHPSGGTTLIIPGNNYITRMITLCFQGLTTLIIPGNNYITIMIRLCFQ